MLRIISVAVVAFAAGFFLQTGLVSDDSPDIDNAAAEKLSVANAMIEAWDTQNWQRVADLFTEDGVLHSMMQEPVVGRETIRKRIVALGAGVESIELSIVNKGVINDVVVLERLDKFVYNGHEGAVPVVGIMAFENGLIKEWREYYDHHDLLEGMGLAPKKQEADVAPLN